MKSMPISNDAKITAIEGRLAALEKTLNDSPAGFLLKKENTDIAERLLLVVTSIVFEVLSAYMDTRSLQVGVCEKFINQTVELLTELKRRARREGGEDK